MRRRLRNALWPLPIYATLALAFWGPWVLGAPRSTIVADNEVDPSAYLWLFSWWPHAIANGLDPFFTDRIFVPDGFNLAWTVSMPGPSLVLSPITLALGATVTWNLLSFAAPVLSAWTAFLLCRGVGAGMIPALLGGYVFGFSPYMLSQLRGAPQLALVALLPLLVLLAVRHVQGRLSDRAFVVTMSVTLAAQMLVSTEVLATAVVFGGSALLAAWLLLAERRAQLWRTSVALLASLAGMAVLTSPLLVSVFFRERTLPEQALAAYPADLLSFVVPGVLVAASGERAGLTVPDFATGAAYFGLPLLVLVAVFAWMHRGHGAARLLVAAFAIAAAAALGKSLVVGGDDTGIPLPWAPFAELPLLRFAIPLRFSAFAFLAAAVVVALWLTWRPTAGRWALALLVVASIAPAVGNTQWHTALADPGFFTGDDPAPQLAQDDRVLVIPAVGPSMRWHASADFGFAMAAGYLGAIPKSYTRYPMWDRLASAFDPEATRVSPASRADLRRFVSDKGVTAVVIEESFAAEWRPLIDTLGVRPVRTGGVLLYRLAAAP